MIGTFRNNRRSLLFGLVVFFIVSCACLLVTSGSAGCAPTNAGKHRNFDAGRLKKMVIDRALPDGPQERTVYVSHQPLPGGSVIESWQSAFTVPESFRRAWFFFIDDDPGANWEHPCRYLFVDADTGKYDIIGAKTPPKKLTDLYQLFP